MDWNNPEEVKEYRREYRSTPRGRAKQMVHHFRYEDKKHNRGECTITEDWILENIFTSKCYYCGETDWRKLGCDRKDNTKSHTPDNVVCACETCNKKRGTIPFAVFNKRLKDGEQLLKKNVPDCSKPVIAKDEDGNIVCEFPSTAEAERSWGYNHRRISECCNGKRQTHRGLYWQYKSIND